MASGKGQRSKWTGKMAKSIGWSRTRFAHLLAHNGLYAPYKSELKALQILKGYGFSLAKYEPSEDAVGEEITPAVVKPFRGLEIVEPNATSKKKGMMPTRVGEGGVTSPPPDPDDEKKKHGSWTDRLLITRLSKLLPGGAIKKNKEHVRYLIQKAGHKRLKDVDEATALEIVKQAGHDISNFEYAAAPGNPVVGAPAREYPSLLLQYTDVSARLQKALDETAHHSATIKNLQEKLTLVKNILLSCERVMTGTPQKPGLAVTKFGGWPKPLNYILDALNELRD